MSCLMDKALEVILNIPPLPASRDCFFQSTNYCLVIKFSVDFKFQGLIFRGSLTCIDFTANYLYPSILCVFEKMRIRFIKNR